MKNDPIIRIVELISYGLFLMDMIVNFITQHYENGKKFTFLWEIANYYFDNGFYLDLIQVIVLPISWITNWNLIPILLLTTLMKLWFNIKKFEKYEYLFLSTNEQEQYYGLIKVFLTNFAIGHFLSIIMNLMPNLNGEINWHIKMGI